MSPFPSLTRGLISIIEQSFSVNKEARLTIISVNELQDFPDRPRESPREFATSSLRPSDGSNQTLWMASGEVSATSSISTPPSVEAMIRIASSSLSTSIAR